MEMSDLIDRQAAIDALDVLCQEHRYRIPGKSETYSQYNEAWQDALDRAENAIGNLPSAQPETHDKRTETHACDLISRQAAIRWVKTECNPYGKPTLEFESGKKVIEHLEQMPSAQPSPCEFCKHNDVAADGICLMCPAERRQDE